MIKVPTETVRASENLGIHVTQSARIRKRQGSELGRQTKILHDAGALIEEIQATWHKSSKGSQKKREEHMLTQTEAHKSTFVRLRRPGSN